MGAVKERFAPAAVTEVRISAVGSASGVVTETVPAAEVPFALVAVTENVYAVLAVSPEMRVPEVPEIVAIAPATLLVNA